MNRICKVNKKLNERIVQGDIYKDVEVIESVLYKDNEITLSKIIFPKMVVLNQDCDLNWDFERNNDDKILNSLLVAPIYNLEHVYQGEHLSELNLRMSPIPSTSKGKESTQSKILKENKNDRYHYIEIQDDKIQIVPSVIDFKHFYTINRDYLYSIKDTNFICRLNELYREDLSRRFTNFLSRIALPD